MGIWVCISVSWLRVSYRGLLSLRDSVAGDTWIEIQTEQCVRNVLHQEPVRLGSSQERVMEKATAIAFSPLVLSNRAVDTCLMNGSL